MNQLLPLPGTGESLSEIPPLQASFVYFILLFFHCRSYNKSVKLTRKHCRQSSFLYHILMAKVKLRQDTLLGSTPALSSRSTNMVISLVRPKTGPEPSVQRQLLFRMVIAASVISIALGIAVFIVEFNRLGSLINDRAGEIAASFNSQIRHLLDSPGQYSQSKLSQELEMLLIAGKSNQRMGQLVYSRIYDIHGKQIASAIDGQPAQLEDIEKLLQAPADLDPGADQRVTIFKRIKKTPYIKMTFPLTNSAGEPAANLEGVFAVSLQARDEVSGRIMRSVLETIGIVLLTTLILYPVIITLIHQLSKLTENLVEANIETLRVVGSAIAKRDSDTDSHNYRVTIYSVTLGEALNLSQSQIQGLIKGAFLHDVGKIGISDQILLKPEKLTDGEVEAMKLHVSHGLDIVKRSEWLKDAVDVVGFHHEKFSGSGYPHGHSGSQIPVNARIFAIADVFDALTSVRPYKNPMSFDQAMEVLVQGRGEHFDPCYLDAFSSIAQLLYQQFAHCSERTLHGKMEAIITRYFN